MANGSTRRMARSLRLPVRDSYNLVLADLTWFIDPATGEELGSVGDIDNDYGVGDLTLNMANLFTPLPQVVGSPIVPSVKTEF